MGHEFMGIVEEVGSEVKKLKKGDRVVVPFPIACGPCFFCTHGASPACENSNYKHYGPNGDLLDQKGAALFGYTDLYGGYSGGQAEYVRVPYRDIKVLIKQVAGAPIKQCPVSHHKKQAGPPLSFS